MYGAVLPESASIYLYENLHARNLRRMKLNLGSRMLNIGVTAFD